MKPTRKGDTIPDTSPPPATIPDDNPTRTLTIADPDAPNALHISLAGDTYTMLVTGSRLTAATA